MITLNQKNNKKGFTLIELLVVVSIIGMLSSVVMAGLVSARQKSQDSYVTQSVGAYITALKAYYADHGYYPDPMHDDVQYACLGEVDYWCFFYNGRPSSDSPYFNNELRTYITSWVDPSPYSFDGDDGSRGAAFTCTIPDPDGYVYNRCLSGEVYWIVRGSSYKNINCGNIGGALGDGVPVCKVSL